VEALDEAILPRTARVNVEIVLIWLALSHCGTACATNSGPLSERRGSGAPCSSMAFCSQANMSSARSAQSARRTWHSRGCSFRIDLPMSASRKMRILSSVVYRLPFILGPFSWPQTITSSGSKKRGHVTGTTVKSETCQTTVGCQLLTRSWQLLYGKTTENDRASRKALWRNAYEQR